MNLEIERFCFVSWLTLGSNVHYLFYLFVLLAVRFFIGFIAWDLDRELRFDVLNVFV
jgi:hypothetical protein